MSADLHGSWRASEAGRAVTTRVMKRCSQLLTRLLQPTANRLPAGVLRSLRTCIVMCRCCGYSATAYNSDLNYQSKLNTSQNTATQPQACHLVQHQVPPRAARAIVRLLRVADRA